MTTEASLREAWGQHVTSLADTDGRILMLDADLANSTKADTFAKAHPDRFLEMGIAEQNMVGVAAGLAFQGYVPWMSSFAVFFTHRAADQIRMLVAQTGANVKIAAAYAGLLTGQTGKTHQDVQDISVMRAMPGMTVLCPADATECRAMIEWANDYSGPVYLRLARDASPRVFDHTYRFQLGSVLSLRTGTDVALVSTGVQTARVVQAAELLETEYQLRPSVIHVPSIKPLDERTLHIGLSGHRLVVTVEEHTVLGGLGGLVAESVTSRGTNHLVRRIGIEDHWGESAPNDDLLNRYGLSATRLAERVAALHTELSPALA